MSLEKNEHAPRRFRRLAGVAAIIRAVTSADGVSAGGNRNNKIEELKHSTPPAIAEQIPRDPLKGKGGIPLQVQKDLEKWRKGSELE